MLEQMQNDPAFQEQMRQMQEIIGQQDEDMTPFLDPGFIGQLGQYQKCISDDLGSDWILSVGQRMTPYIQQIQGLCQAGRFSAAKAYLEDEDNAKQFFSSREWTVMDRCQQQFPEESMLSMQPDPNQTGQEICRDFMN